MLVVKGTEQATALFQAYKRGTGTKQMRYDSYVYDGLYVKIEFDPDSFAVRLVPIREWEEQ